MNSRPLSPPMTCKTCGQAITFPTRQAYPMTERERSDVIERFRHIAETDSRVLASFLGGSLPAGTADAYSDIDNYFVVDPSEYNSCGGTGIGTVSCSRRVQEIISGLLNFHSPPCEGGPSIFSSSSTSPPSIPKG